jgi:hypothetical protein
MSLSQSRRLWTGWSFLVCGLLTLGVGIAILAQRVIALKKWVSVPGTVTKSIVIGPDPQEGNFSAQVTVRWSFQGGEYSKRFANWGNGGESQMRGIVARHPEGSTTPILCDPAKPSRGYLDAGFRPGFFFAPIICIAVGLIFSILGYLLLPRSS